MVQATPPLFDPKKSREAEYQEGPGRAVRPRDAATLILVRNDGPTPRVLMGQRHTDHKFMPNKFVFPGGRVDAADSRVRPAQDLLPHVETRLMHRMRGMPTPTRARALAMAAIRETFEETGLIIGQPVETPGHSRHTEWAEYFAQGVSPSLTALDFVARAITPPYRTRRFDTRFFIADASTIHGDPVATSGSGELQGLHWVTMADARDLDLPNITRVVLDEIDERMRLREAEQKQRPVPFIYFRRGHSVRDTIKD